MKHEARRVTLLTNPDLNGTRDVVVYEEEPKPTDIGVKPGYRLATYYSDGRLTFDPCLNNKQQEVLRADVLAVLGFEADR